MLTSQTIARCISCGAPLAKDQATAGETGPRCAGCLRDDGTPKPWSEVVDDLAAFLVKALDLTDRAARRIAVERLSTLPAWATRRHEGTEKKGTKG